MLFFLIGNILLPDDISIGMFRTKGSGAISAASILSKNLIFQLAEISNNKLIFSYLHHRDTSSDSSFAHCLDRI